MLFNLQHILFISIATVTITVLLILAAKFVKKQETKNLILKAAAIATVALYYSNIWVEFFGNAGSTSGLANYHLIPVYPCNIMLWMLFITSMIKNKSSKFFTVLAEFCFWAGIICGTFGIVLNENYRVTGDLTNWALLQELLNHCTMIFGCFYLLVGKYIKIRVFNVVSVTLGLLFFILEGSFVNALFAKCGLPEVNAMYLLHSPYPDLPWLSPMLLGASAILVLFGCLALYELRLPKEERWYSQLKHFTEKIFNKHKGQRL
ncbi:MAG: YwaF family protein [Clostridia bacterium]|nr:YwaF family protein [Clostridia bacterium]